MDKGARGVALVSAGSLILVVMATVVKHLGTDLPAMEILFFRALVGFFFILPIFARDPMEPWRTKRFGMHFVRGATGALGMALQFSRPLFMLPLAVFFLGEVAGWRRSMVAVVGFLGIMLYARPFTAGFDPSAVVGAAGALVGGLVVIGIKQLAKTEPTRVIMRRPLNPMQSNTFHSRPPRSTNRWVGPLTYNDGSRTAVPAEPGST